MTTDSFSPEFRRALAGRYALERRLGRGGMGIVYLARDLRLDRRVAIKLLPPERASQPSARERFLREARTAAQLSHPGIVPIFAVHEVQDFVFFVMAYVDGETLGQRVRDGGPLGHAAAASILEEVARALAHAHSGGVVHRDVKPDNILLERATGRALVSDFGIARMGSGAGSTSGPQRVMGTAWFMSPEQATGAPVDARSDLYSLGVVGFFVLSGRLPFEGTDDIAVLARHVTDPPPLLATVAPDVPLRLAQAIDRCLAKDPGARYESGEALAEALASALDRRAAVAVRAFVTQAGHLATTVWLYGAAASLVLVVTAIRFGRATLVGVAATIVVVPLVVSLGRVRRLVRAGYGRRDLTDALLAELTHRREELAFLYGHGPTRLERVLRGATYTCLSAAAGIVGAVLDAPELNHVAGISTAFAVVSVCAILAALVARRRTELRTDPRTGRRLRFWSGRLGGWLFKLAGLHLAPSDPLPASAALSPVGAPATPVPGGRDA
ncbi:MAG TPA: serine/threonine-protein kinase [Gemmatimonadales bacterium]|nr:serine/threonine-protein kinase [Gemmatimonadales bacterium]